MRVSPDTRVAVAQVGAVEAVQTLVQLGAQVELRDADGKTSREIAEAAGHAHVAEVLGRKGAK